MKQSSFSAMIVFLTCIAFAPLCTQAAPAPIAFKVNAPQNVAKITAKKMVMYTTLSGNDIELLKLSVIAPRGSKVTIKEGYAAQASRIKSLNRSAKKFIPLTIIETKAKSSLIGGKSIARSSPVLRSSKVARAGEGTIDCSLYTVSEINELIAFYKREYNFTTTIGQICGTSIPKDSFGNGGGSNGTNNGNGGNTTSDGTSQNLANQYVSVFVKKDVCTKNTKARYVVRLEFDFSKARISKLSEEEKFINIVGETSTYKGVTASTLKPVSDGMFKPDPLLLMSSTGYYFGSNREKVELLSIKGGIFSTRGVITAENRFVPYKGLNLLTFQIKSYLGSGERVTALLSNNDYNAYGICLRLKRTRQNINGYPN